MSDGMPRPNENHERLERLAGKWVGEERMQASPWGPGGNATGRYDARMALEGFFLIQDYAQEKGGRVDYRGHGVLGFDEQRQQYAWYWVDSMGSVPAAPSFGTWEGDTLTLMSENPGMGFSRYTYTIGADRYSFRLENSRDGNDWTLFMEGDFQRQ